MIEFLFLVKLSTYKEVVTLITHLYMKCSLGFSSFLEEISSLSHSIVFLYSLALVTEAGFLISLCYSLDLCIQMGISFLFSLAFCLEVSDKPRAYHDPETAQRLRQTCV